MCVSWHKQITCPEN